MKIHGNDIIIHRGETFTLSMNVKMRDGTPFIMTCDPKNLAAHNPHILITIASSKYAQKNSYVRNWWLPMKPEEPDETAIPSFTSTEIKPLTSLTQGSSDGVNDDGVIERYLYYNQQTGKYYYDASGGKSDFKEYAFKIHRAFTHAETKELVSQSYYYSITYVDGPLNYDDDGVLSDERIKNFSQVTPIISPSKLTVLSNLRGGL
jgi:hypothetical protein